MSLPRYPEYKDSGVEWLGEVPAHWEVDRFKRSVVSCRNGIWGDDPQSDQNDIPCVRVADFDRQRLRVELSDPTLRSITEKERKGRLLRRGDLLLEKSGGGELQPVGCVVLYDDDTDAVCSNFVARAELAAGMDSSFWRYQHAAAYAVRLNTRSIKQTSGIQNLDAQQYLDERCAFPPLDEQAHIAEFLDRETAKIDALVAEQQRLIELLKEKRQAVISHAVTKGLNPNAPMKDSGIEWLGEVPAHWVVARLVYRLRETPMYGVLVPDHDADGVLMIRTTDIADDHRVSMDDVVRITPSLSEQYRRTMVQVGDVVVSVVGTIGKAFVVDSDVEGANLSRSLARVQVASGLRSSFLLQLIGSRVVTVFTDLVCAGAAQKVLNMGDLCDWKVPIPPVREQDAIVEALALEVSTVDELVAEATRAIDLLTERRTTLISAAVTGQIDVRPRPQKAPR